MAGQLAGLQMGLGFALFFDPESSGQAPLVAEFYGLIAILTLLATNGHYVILTALAESFRVLPLMVEPMSARGFLTLVSWGGQIFEIGLMMSLPVVGALLIANIGIGILTRAAPQLNIFAVGFPVTLTVGFVMLYLSLPLIVPMIDSLAQGGIAAIMRILEPTAARAVSEGHGFQDPSPWIVRWASELAPGTDVLDVACGGGRHTRFLAARGHRVTAVDRDPRVGEWLADVPRYEDRGRGPRGGSVAVRRIDASAAWW